MLYLDSYHLKDLKKFCQIEAQKIIQSKRFEEDLAYYREYWMGFIYGIKILNKLIITNNIPTKHTLYYYFKTIQCKNNKRGFKDSIYLILNEISNIQKRVG